MCVQNHASKKGAYPTVDWFVGREVRARSSALSLGGRVGSVHACKRDNWDTHTHARTHTHAHTHSLSPARTQASTHARTHARARPHLP